MLTKISKNSLFVWLISIVISSCSPDSDNPGIENIRLDVENTVKASTWVITMYMDDNEDETYHYNGYEFIFGDNGMLTATNGPNTYTGTWSITGSNSSSSSDENLDFNIFFSSPEEFEELSDDWDIRTYSDNLIELIDVSGGDGISDYLTFRND